MGKRIVLMFSLLVASFIYNENSDVSKATYNNWRNAYMKASSYFSEDIEKNYPAYISLNSTLMSYVASYVIGYIISNVIAYVASFSILMIICPLLSKRNKTSFGEKFAKIDYALINDNEATFINRLIFNILKLVMYVPVIFLGCLFSGGVYYLGFMLGGFNMFQIIIFSSVLAVISLLMLLLTKRNQLLSMFLSKMVAKDY